MPRRDPTFSSADLVRFFLNNLTKEEQVDVVCFFKTYVDFTSGIFGVRKISEKMVSQMTGALATFFGVGGDLFNLFIDMFSIFVEFQELNACLRRNQRLGSSLTRRVPGLTEAIRDLAEQSGRHDR